MSSEWYDPDGNPMGNDLSAWSDRKNGGAWEREHLETKVEGGTVSTVWLGLDHSYNEGPPLIFESMIFADCARVVAEALTTHHETHDGEVYSLGDPFADLIRAIGDPS